MSADTPALDAESTAIAAEAALDALLAALAHLEEAIAQEALAVGAVEAERLLDAVDAKRRALAEVERIVRLPELSPLLEAPAIDHGPLARSAAWPRLLEKLDACRSSNEAVGGALAVARRSNEASLRWLGLAADAGTYDDPRRGPAPRGRDLAVC